MIQRIQTIYFIIVMVLLSALLSGVEIFGFTANKGYFTYSVYGVQFAKTAQGKVENIQGSVLFYFVILFVLFIYYALMSYKNLKKQFRLARLVFWIYAAGLIAILVTASLGVLVPSAVGIQLGIGYYMAVVGLPFTYFALKGVQKDKEILESLDRLR